MNMNSYPTPIYLLSTFTFIDNPLDRENVDIIESALTKIDSMGWCDRQPFPLYTDISTS